MSDRRRITWDQCQEMSERMKTGQLLTPLEQDWLLDEVHRLVRQSVAAHRAALLLEAMRDFAAKSLEPSECQDDRRRAAELVRQLDPTVKECADAGLMAGEKS